MIVTVTPNPALDRTLEVPDLPRGEVVRATATRTDPGGKGLNVARALVATGHPSRVVVPVGGTSGRRLLDAAHDAGLDTVAVDIAAEVRTNLSLVEPDGRVTKINEPGPHLTAAEVAALRAATLQAVEGATWLASCGSLPPGVPTDAHAQLVADGHAAGVRVAVDASGAALVAALAAGPDLIKPNVHELAELVGHPVRTVGEVADAAAKIVARGVDTVVVSLGADGAVLVDGDSRWHATNPAIVVRSAVGAGDALVAGLLAAGGRGPTALRSGVAYGAGAAALPGTQFPTSAQLRLDEVQVHDLDPDRELIELTEPGGCR